MNRWRNRLSFGLGTLGRDMSAALVSLYLMYYLTDVARVPASATAAVTVVLVVLRVFDALNDPIMGLIIDNTRSRWGKFKPWIALGGVLWAAATLAIFVDTGLTGWAFIVWFTVIYLLWSVAYTINDIAFWSMLPALSQEQRERERIGAAARIVANIGLFTVVVTVLPATKALGERLGDERLGWLAFAGVLVALKLLFQLLTLLFAEQQTEPEHRPTSLREVVSVIGRNDQLLWVTAAMLCFMAGYMTVTSLGIYWFKYVHGNEDDYPLFAAILAAAQLTGLAIFPALRRRLPRRGLHTLATVLCLAGLGLFWFAASSMATVALAGALLFTGQAFIQLLMLMYITDCVEYGQWKLGRRNESITLAVQPFIYKASNGLGSGLTGAALLASGISGGQSVDVTTFQTVMFAVPMVLTVASWLILRRGYRLDEQRFAEIVADLERRPPGPERSPAVGQTPNDHPSSNPRT
ncbi:glycoside-pentoside-hexuronide (GPH):cation symporter [Tessaracoccus sp. OH4464_COT-324]|uniref:glycoside-pentoside-hexuronide (GPH):cation symporter n=1 Tax=Tessaracoccus sp. OH4464_COT-324 TaxID=2491059 RepID=UPI000F62D2A0|nr:glycoside-pentoside-hexuronide (GPH):cation symporter [Tessaracoccus sp. OH4464_COT-324]RRD45615.1 sugar transporter [Tessaracoccus sp. OH4464_COT-324]